MPENPALGEVCSLANYSVAYEETQSNRVTDFRDFVCSLFPKAIFFYFYSHRTGIVIYWNEKQTVSFYSADPLTCSGLLFSNGIFILSCLQ